MGRGGWLTTKPLKGISKFFKPFATGFEGALDIAGIELAKSLDAPNLTPLEIAGIAEFINNFRGLTSSARLGVSPRVRQMETAALLAPRYNRSIAALLFSMTRRGVRGDQARIHMLRGIGAVAALGWALSAVRGESLDEMVEHYNPNSNKFFTWEFAGQNLGPGTKIRSVAKLGGDILEDPGSLGVVEEGNILRAIQKNPGLRFLRGNLAPISGRTPLDLLVGQDFIGDPTRDGALSFTKTVGENFMPIYLASILFEGGTMPERLVRGGVEVIGGRAYPQNMQWELASEWRSDLEPYFDIATTEEERIEKGQPRRLTRLAYRKANAEIDAKLFILGRVTTLRSNHAKILAGDIIMSNPTIVGDLDESDKENYEKIFTERGLAALVQKGLEIQKVPEAPSQKKFSAFDTLQTSRWHPQSATIQGEVPEPLTGTALWKWSAVSGRMDSSLLRATTKVWEGGTLTPTERTRLEAIWKQFPLGQDNFNTWLKQTLRQLQTNAAIEANKRQEEVLTR
jgi:hypothetical protein